MILTFYLSGQKKKDQKRKMIDIKTKRYDPVSLSNKKDIPIEMSFCIYSIKFLSVFFLVVIRKIFLTE